MVSLADVIPQVGLKAQSGGFGSANTVRLEITNWNEVMKVLRGIDGDYITGLRKDFKRIAKPVQKKVQRSIPSKSKPPLTNMRQVWFGRLAWGSTWGGIGGSSPKPAQSVLIQLPNTRKKKYRDLERVPIVRLQVGSPGTVLYDMAYRRNGTKGRKGLTPEYDYIYRTATGPVPGKRRHRVVPGAFRKGIMKSTGKTASRIVWPAAESALPQFTNEARTVIYNINRRIQFELIRKQ